jgi:hypothetical protein
VLLAAPGRDITARELAGRPAPAGADAVLDDRARQAYRARLAELSAAMAAAEAAGDAARSEQARAEHGFLARELAAAAGLGGRPRRLGDEAEKIRKTVTARMRHTIGRITRVHPELGSHLEASIRTGTRCGYHPPTPTGWDT